MKLGDRFNIIPFVLIFQDFPSASIDMSHSSLNSTRNSWFFSSSQNRFDKRVKSKDDCFKAAFSRGSKLLNFACSHPYHVSQNTVFFCDRTYTAIKNNWRQIEHRWDYHPLFLVLSSLRNTQSIDFSSLSENAYTHNYLSQSGFNTDTHMWVCMMFAFFVRGSSFCCFFAACTHIHSCRNFVKESRKLSSMFYVFLFFLVFFHALQLLLAKGCERTCLLESSDCCFPALTLHIECLELNIGGSTHSHITAADYGCSINDHCFTWAAVRVTNCIWKCASRRTTPLGNTNVQINKENIHKNICVVECDWWRAVHTISKHFLVTKDTHIFAACFAIQSQKSSLLCTIWFFCGWCVSFPCFSANFNMKWGKM